MQTDARNIVPLTVGLLLLVIGCIVMLGWQFNSSPIVQIQPNWVPMQFNTALGMFLSGFGIIAWRLYWRKAQLLSVVLLILLGASSFIQYLFDVDFGIDQLFHRHEITTLTSDPGRMAPNTALTFMLCACALLISRGGNKFHNSVFAQTILGGMLLALGISALLGYGATIDTSIIWTKSTKMAAHTATGTALLGVAFLSPLFRKDILSAKGGALLLGVPIVTNLLSLSFSISAAIYIQEHEKAKTQIARDLSFLLDEVQLEMEYVSRSLQMMADRWDNVESNEALQWREDGESYLAIFGSIFSLHWMNEKGEELWHVTKRVEGNTVNLQEVLQQEMGANIESRRYKVVNFIGQRHLTLFIPVYENGDNAGYLGAIFQLESFIDRIFDGVLSNQYGIRVRIDGQPIFSHNPSDPLSHMKEVRLVSIEGMDYEFEFIATRKMADSFSTSLPVVAMVFAVVVIGFLIALLGFLTNSMQKRKLLDTEIVLRKQLTENFKRLLDSAPVGMLQVSMDGKIAMANHEITELFGYKADELVGQSVEILIPDDVKDKHVNLRQGYTQAPVKRAMGIEMDIHGRRKDGSQFSVEIGLNPLKSIDGDFMVASIMDRSEREQSQQKLMSYATALERSNKELDEFAYVASHDLKSPLRGIGQLTNWIEDDFKSGNHDEIIHHTTMVKNRIARMVKLLDDLLDYSRVGQEHALSEVDSRQLIQSCYDLVATDTSTLVIEGDNFPKMNTVPVPLEQIFMNLFGNAIKHAQPSSVVIKVSLKITDSGYEFRISDDGPGILPEHHQKIFEMFRKLKSRDEVEGSGLGLSLIKKTLDVFGGTIRVESDGASGTTFIFMWPADDRIKKIAASSEKKE